MERSAARSLRSVCFSGFRAGSLARVWMGPSVHSFSGHVLRLGFARQTSATSFARRWAARIGASVAVSREGALVWVSVPVALPHSRYPGSGRVVVVSGGLRVLCQELNSSGIVRGS
jgi:hypothetical protein